MKKSDYDFQESYALIIGIDHYENITKLETAVNDARRLKAILEEKHGYMVLDLLIDADKEGIVDALQALSGRVSSKDRLLIYFAGHGVAYNAEDGPQAYLLPADADKDDPERNIAMDYLSTCLQALACRHCLVLLDCCFSGAVRWSVGYRSPNMFHSKKTYRQKYDQYLKDPAWQIITSTAHDEKAIDLIYEKPLGARIDRQAQQKEHSPFATALFAALEGGADLYPKGNGVMTATELYLYLREAVTPLSIRVGRAVAATSSLSTYEKQTPSLFHFPKHDRGEYVFLTDKFRYSQLPSIEDYQVNPYKGLLYYQESEADVFYGRVRAVQELYDLVMAKQLVVVTGASGTGKSSLVRAGLLPKLKEYGFTIWPLITPGVNPVESIQTAISLFADGMPEDHSKLERTVLVIDQYEEIITQSISVTLRNEWDKFMTQLLELTIGNFKIVILVRSDFEPQFSEFDHFKFWKNARYVVPPMTTAELHEIIEQPAAQRALFFDPETLVRQIAEEVQQQAGSLPLLSFTLSEIYKLYLNDGFLKHSQSLEKKYYDQLGGVVGSLRKRANEIYTGFDTKHQDILRIALLRMVSSKGGNLSKRRVKQGELNWEDEAMAARAQHVLKILVEERLIVAGTDQLTEETYYEPAHDALVNAWEKIQLWVRDISIDTFEIVRSLSEAAQQYQALGEEQKGESIYTQKTLLWSNDPRMDIIKAFKEKEKYWFNKTEHIFIADSIQRREDILAQTKKDLQEKQEQLLRSQSNEKSLEARLLLKEDTTRAIRLAEESVDLFPTENGHTVMGEIFFSSFFYRKRAFMFPDHSEPYTVFAAYNVSDQHQHLSFVLVCENNKILLLNPRTRSRTIIRPFTPNAIITASALSPSKTHLLIAATHGDLRNKGGLKLLRIDAPEEEISLLEVFDSEINTISICLNEEQFVVSGCFGVTLFEFAGLTSKEILLQNVFKKGDYDIDDSNAIAVFNATDKKHKYYNSEKHLLVSRNGILKIYNIDSDEWLPLSKEGDNSFEHRAILYHRDYAFSYSAPDGKVNVHQFHYEDPKLVSFFLLDKQPNAQFFKSKKGDKIGVTLGTKVRFLTPTPEKITFDLLPQELNGFENVISSASFSNNSTVLITLHKTTRGAVEFYYSNTDLQLYEYKEHIYGSRLEDRTAPPKIIDRDNYIMKIYDDEEKRSVVSFGKAAAEDVWPVFSTKSEILNFDAQITTSETIEFDIRLAALTSIGNRAELLVWHHFYTSYESNNASYLEEEDYHFLLSPDLRYQCKNAPSESKWLYFLKDIIIFQSADVGLVVVKMKEGEVIDEKNYRFPKQIVDVVCNELENIIYVLTEKKLHRINVEKDTTEILHESDFYKSSIAFNSTYDIAAIGVSVTLGESPSFYLVSTKEYSTIAAVKIVSKHSPKNLGVARISFLNDHLVCTLDEDSLKVWDVYTQKNLFDKKIINRDYFSPSDVKGFKKSKDSEELLILCQTSNLDDKPLTFISLKSPSFVLKNNLIDTFKNKKA